MPPTVVWTKQHLFKGVLKGDSNFFFGPLDEDTDPLIFTCLLWQDICVGDVLCLWFRADYLCMIPIWISKYLLRNGGSDEAKNGAKFIRVYGETEQISIRGCCRLLITLHKFLQIVKLPAKELKFHLAGSSYKYLDVFSAVCTWFLLTPAQPTCDFYLTIWLINLFWFPSIWSS